jgi:hypothetical protein
MELIILFFLYGGGLVAALVFMALATRRISRSSVITFGVLALFCLVVQGSCWRIATGIGQATGGAPSNGWITITVASFVIFVFWFLVLLSTINK